MQARLLSWWNGIVARWKGLERRQKLGILAAAAAVVVALAIAILVLNNPKKVAFYTATSAMEVNEITSALQAQGISYTTRGLTVYVPERDVLRAQMEYEMLSVASSTSFTWDNVLSGSGMGTSRKIIDQNLINYYQSRIEQQLQYVKGIDRASVTLGIPESTSYFITSGEERTANVVIYTNTSFNKGCGDALARSVARSVVDLKLENIFIMDQNAEVIFSGEVSENGQLSARNEYNAALQAQIEKNVRSVLTPWANQIYIAPNLSVDWTAVYEEAVRYLNPAGDDSSQGYIGEDMTIKSSGTTGNGAAEPGVNANDVTVPTYVTGAESTGEQSYLQYDRSFIYDVINSVTQSQPGKLLKDDSSVSVTAVRYKTYKESNYVAQGNVTWEQFKENMQDVTWLETDDRLVELVRSATGIEKVVLLIAEKAIFENTVVSNLQWQQVSMLVLLGLVIAMLAYGLLKRAKPDDLTELEPELSVEDLLVSTQIEEDKELEMAEEERLREIKMAQDSETKQQIERFVDLRPESAAQLLRSWLNEDWE